MEDNKKEVEIDIDKLIVRVYNKIALWNNEERERTSQEKAMELKILAHDVVSDIITTAFSKLEGAKVKEKIIPGEKPKERGIFKLLNKKK